MRLEPRKSKRSPGGSRSSRGTTPEKSNISGLAEVGQPTEKSEKPWPACQRTAKGQLSLGSQGKRGFKKDPLCQMLPRGQAGRGLESIPRIYDEDYCALDGRGLGGEPRELRERSF